MSAAGSGAAAEPRALPFEAVLFDCDGVLVDSEAITIGVLMAMLNELGWPLDKAECMERFLGKTIDQEHAQIFEHTGYRIDEAWVESFRARRNVELQARVEEIPGAPQAVRRVHELYGGRIACASGADLGKVHLQLTKIGLLDAFAGRTFSGIHQARSKPAPDVYLTAAAALGADPTRCAVVEDTVTGATAGVAAGASVLGYSPGGHDHAGAESLRRAGAVAIFTDMAELPRLLASGLRGM